jgi:hypothetical protein
MADEFKLDFDKIQAEQNGNWVGGTGDWIYQFAKSSLWSGTAGLLGMAPPQDTVRWQNDNPWSGLASELAGMVVPYGGWMKAARGIKSLEAVATGIEASKLGTAAGDAALAAKSLESPFFTAAKAEAVRLAPFELGRVAANQAVGDQSFGEMTAGAGINIALGGLVGGTLGKLGAMGKVAPGIRDIAPEVNDAVPGQLLLRQLDEKLPQLPELADHLPDIEMRVRGEEAPKGTQYISSDLDAKGQLEKLFTPGTDDKGYIVKQKPVTGSGEGEFTNEQGWQQALKASGMDERTATRYMQFPRVVSLSTAPEMETHLSFGLDAPKEFPIATQKADWVERAIMDRLQPVGDGWLAAQEGHNGMFVMAKKIQGDLPGELPPKDKFIVRGRMDRKPLYRAFASEENFQSWLKANPKAKVTSTEWGTYKGGLKRQPSPDDKWLLFKTDQPGKFVTNSQGFMNAQVAREKWIVGANALETVSKETGPVADALRLQSMVPKDMSLDAATAAGSPGQLSKFWERVAPRALRNNQATQHGADFIRRFVAPAAKQFSKSPLASWIWNQGRMINETIDSWYQKALQGEYKFSGDRAIFSKIVPASYSGRSVEAIIGDMDKEGLLGEFLRLHRQGIPLDGAKEMANAGLISPRTVELAGELRTLREQEHGFLNQSERINGAKESKLRADDYGLPRQWNGDFMHLVREEGGQIVGIGSGASQTAAKKQAEALAKQLRDETGRPHRLGEAFHRGQDVSGLPSDVRPFIANPGGTLANRNIRGFRWDLETPKLQDLLKEYQQAFQGRANIVSANIRDAALAQHIGALTVHDPASAKIIADRFNQMAGRTSEWGRAQNKLVDKFLGPVFGANSATKIVSAFNTGMTHVQLGAFKLSYPIQNLVGVVQTVAPELAFVLNSPTLSSVYHEVAPAVGSKGAVGAIGTLSPMKVLAQAMKMAWKPEADERIALEWALNNRVLDARIAEDFIGQNRRTLSGWKGALSSPKAFAEFGLALSEWLPQHSERFARVVSFNAGYKVAKDVLRVADEDARRMFAKRFVERTNYMYSSADRPLMFTTPIGSALGLFKTWQMNFIYTMAEYANLGFNKGVWSPLMWQTLGTAALGGAAATPLYWAAEGASHFFKNKSLIQYAYDEWNGQADGIMFGLPAALTGVSLSGLMASPGANPVKDATQLFSIASWTRMKEAGGAVQAAIDNWQATGQHPGTDPDVRNQLIKAFAPVILQRAMAVDDEGTVRNIGTQMPTAKGLSFYDRMMYQMGMQPVMLERQMAATEALYQDKQKMAAATKAFGDAIADRFREGKPIDDILQRAIAMGVDTSSALRSGVGAGRLELKTAPERQARPATLMNWQNVLGQ